MRRRDACIVCQTSITDSIAGLKGYQICRHCDVAWCLADDPVDPAGEWENYYTRKEIVELHESRRSGMEAIISRLGAISANRGRLLDVGAGLGIFMELAAKDGWTVEGIEPSKTAIEQARKLRGAIMHHGLLEDVPLPAHHYDVVTVIDILRTVPDPMRFLRSARRLLRPGGILLVREGDRRIDTAFRWLTRRRGIRKLNKRSAYTFAQVFSPKSLSYAFRLLELEVWVEPSPVFSEFQVGAALPSSLARRAIGLASQSLYRATAGRIIMSPNLLAYGRVPA